MVEPMLFSMDGSARSQTFGGRAWALGIGLTALLLFSPVLAQAPKPGLKPTEAVVKRYERLILRGALLTPEGWKLASEFFTLAEPYPANGDIQVEWTGTRTLGEERNDGSRAQVNTKWNDYYGTIDSNLRFKSDHDVAMPMFEQFTLVLVPQQVNAKDQPKSFGSQQGQWKIEGPLRGRAADPQLAIKYLAKMRDQTTDPTLRKNAQQSIKTLKHFRSNCGVPNPC